MTPGPDARVFDLGYRRYEDARRDPWSAVGVLALFTARRVLGLGRGGRHKILPALALAVAYVPALVSVVVATVADELQADELISYGEYTFLIGSALVLFAALVAPEALCPDRRTAMLSLYLAGPLDRTRYLLAKGAAVLAVMVVITVGPLLFMLLAFAVAGHGPSASETPELVGRILALGVPTAALYASLALAVSSFTTRRAAAAVAIVLLVLVPPVVAGTAIDSAGAPDELDLVSIAFVASDLGYRIFGETADDRPPIADVATWLVAAALALYVLAGAAACWLRYRRSESFR
jgi:ABC-2 type transport system permease protein